MCIQDNQNLFQNTFCIVLHKDMDNWFDYIYNNLQHIHSIEMKIHLHTFHMLNRIVCTQFHSCRIHLGIGGKCLFLNQFRIVGILLGSRCMWYHSILGQDGMMCIYLMKLCMINNSMNIKLHMNCLQVNNHQNIHYIHSHSYIYCSGNRIECICCLLCNSHRCSHCKLIRYFAFRIVGSFLDMLCTQHNWCH